MGTKMMSAARTSASLCSPSRHTTLGRPSAAPMSAKATISLKSTLPAHSLRIGFGKYDRRVVVRAEDKSADAEASKESEEAVDSEESGESSDEAEVVEESGSSSDEMEEKSAAMVIAALKDAAADDMAEDLTYLEGEIIALTEQLNEAKAKAKHQETVAIAAKEQFLRSTADFENYRRRTDTEKDALRDDVKSSVVTDFLPLVDNFELAGKQLVLETEGEKKVDSAYQALYRQMVDIFKQLGVTPVDTVGVQFDPEVHEAIMNEPSETAADGEVLEEFRRGFLINGKLIRPAMVKVAVNDNPAPASGDSPSSSEDEDTAGEADAEKEPASEAESK